MSLQDSLKDKTTLLTLAFFSALLIVGLFVFPHYGVHTDERVNQQSGRRFARYIQNFNILKPVPYELRERKDPRLQHDVSTGPAFELVLIFVQKILKLVDLRDIVLMRHLCTFLLFYISVFFFYRLSRLYFKDPSLALLGCLFLVLNPRIFSNAFYNSTDIAFLSFYIISTYTLFMYLKKRTAAQAAWHALACAFLTDIRLPGSLIAIITVFIVSFESFQLRKDALQLKRNALSLGIFICLFVELTILFSPLLWIDPAKRFLTVFHVSTFSVQAPAPWYYNPVWILVTTPPLYLVFFFAGIFSVAGSFLRKDPSTLDQRTSTLIILALLGIPLIAPVILKTYLYCDWRHHYFVYPMIVLVALLGVKRCLGLINARMEERGLRIVRSVFFAVVGLCLAATAWTLVTLHPYQNIYFNLLKRIPFVERLCVYIPSDKNPDYWRLSLQEVFREVLELDKRPVIRVNIRPDMAALIPAEDRKRLVFTDKYSKLDYRFAGAGIDLPSGAPFKEFYSVVVNGEKIRTVYKRMPRTRNRIVPDDRAGSAAIRDLFFDL